MPSSAHSVCPCGLAQVPHQLQALLGHLQLWEEVPASLMLRFYRTASKNSQGLVLLGHHFQHQFLVHHEGLIKVC